MSRNDSMASPCPNLSIAIREKVPTAILARVYPKRRSVTQMFDMDFELILTSRQVEADVAGMIRRGFGDAADWRLAHDFHLPTATLYLSPEPHQNGYVPEDDRTFGLATVHRVATYDGNRR
ncbi:hypothetical protein [Streptomyces sp. NPDC060194]|uniref:hypothetical protein n=1 Tax=Streptomyces sp. NPDC060194 TaxID=3347069 RepID=UPI00364D8421